MAGRRSPLLLAAILIGYGFLYLPLAVLVVYSFNASRLVSVWAGWSLHWYGELLRNDRMLDATWLSLRIAVATATLATVLGTLAGFALARLRRFRGRRLFAILLSAPLVMPDVILGLALLLLFVAMEQGLGWPADRGVLTIVLSHTTMALAFVAVIVQARLADMDRSIEEAALDLGAPPWKVFLVITLPLAAPALLSGWLLAFTLSLDDVVIASFVTGPGATTLPLLVFSSVRLGLSPQINALAALVVGVVAAGVAVATLVAQRRSRRPAAPA